MIVVTKELVEAFANNLARFKVRTGRPHERLLSLRVLDLGGEPDRILSAHIVA